MPITDKQLIDRTRYLGSSDSPAILGMSDFKNAKDVWVEKKYPLYQIKPTKDMKRGNYLEPALLKYASDETGYKIAQNQFRKTDIFGAHLDAQAYKRVDDLEYNLHKKEFLSIGFEAKSSRVLEGWGDPGTDEVPPAVLIQIYHQMYAADLQTVYVPRIAPWSLDMQLFVIERTPEIDNDIYNLSIYLKWWWKEYIDGNIEPPITDAPHYDVVRRIKRVPGSFAESIDIELIEQWEKSKENKCEYEKKEEEIKAQILLKLGTTEGCNLSDGRILTYIPNKNGTRILRIKKG